MGGEKKVRNTSRQLWQKEESLYSFRALPVKTAKYCVNKGTETLVHVSSPASLKCHVGADLNAYGFASYPQLSPVHKSLSVFFLVFLCLSSEPVKWR